MACYKNLLKILRLWIWFTISIPGLLVAEDAYPHLKSYICHALQNNSELEAAFYDWQATLFDMQASDTLPDPKIGYGYFIKSVETRVGPQENRLNISQMFPWIGKLKNRKNLAYKKSLMAEQKWYVLTHALIRKLKDAFYNQYFFEKSIQLTQENIALVNILEGVAQRRVQVGASAADAIQAQIEINKLHDNVDALEKKELSLIARIIALMNAPPQSFVKVPVDLFESEEEIPEIHSEEELQKNNPTLILLSLQKEKEKANYQLVHQDRFPDVAVGVDWIDTGRAIAPTKDNGKNAIVASVSVNLPIWTSTYRARENSAKSHIISAGELLTQKSQEIFADYEDIILKYQDAERRAVLYRETLLPQAKQALEILIESYKSAKTEFDRVLESQRILLFFQLEYERAIVDRAKAVNAYEELIGACII